MTDLLDRWGLIADYLKVSEKTAIRYKERGLPITYDPAGHPTITKQEIDDWKKNNTTRDAA
jgi:hypothetical protein